MSNFSNEITIEAYDESHQLADGVEVMEVCPSDVETSNKENENPDEFNETDLNDLQEQPNGSLFAFACDRKLKTEDVCQNWIELYMSNPDEALMQFLQFILDASGCQYKIPRSRNSQINFSHILIDATVNFRNKSATYPLICKTSNTFMKDVTEFVQTLMHRLNPSPIILDDYFLKNITGFILVFVDSKVRAFRHTTTLIALKIMTALSTTVSLENEKLKEIWLQLFEGVFVERAADYQEEIRFMCVTECSLWLEKYPECFLDPKHIKHLFQSLQDNARKVCECSFQALFKLYDKPELRAACIEQGIKHKMTLLGLTMSAESELGQMSLQLLGQFYKAAPQILDESMLHVIEELVFAAHRGVAHAAADVVPFRHQEGGTDQQRIAILLNFFMRFGEHEHSAYLVDAFYGRNNIVLAWSSMVAMLLQPESMSSKETSALIDIMSHAVKQAVTGEVPQGRYTEDLVRQPQPNAGKLATSILLPHLPKLLRKYSKLDVDVEQLLELPQHMILLQTQFQDLLEQIKDIMFGPYQTSVLQMGAVTLDRLYGIDTANANHCKELLNDAVTNYMIAVNSWEQSLIASSQSPAPNGQTKSERLLVTLRLLSALYAHFDLHDWQLTDGFLRILRKVVDGNDNASPLSVEAVCLYFKTIYYALAWDLRCVKSITNDDPVVNLACLELRQRLDFFLPLSFRLVKTESDIKISCNAVAIACDLLVLFSYPLRQSSIAAVRSIEYKSKICDYELLEKFLLSCVFVAEDEVPLIQLQQPVQFTLLQNKRLILASYCKLIVNNVMPMMRASNILQFYKKFNSNLGDIMRTTMDFILSINPTNFGMTLMHTCLLVYKRVRAKHADPLQAAASSEFAELILLAKLLAEHFSSRQLEARESMIILHRAGIRFAWQDRADSPTAAPQNLLYLTVVEQFVPQLLAQDMVGVLRFLQLSSGQLEQPNCLAEELKPLVAYRNTLEIAIAQSCRRNELNNLLNCVDPGA